jgi:hypothetical protein
MMPLKQRETNSKSGFIAKRKRSRLTEERIREKDEEEKEEYE